MGGYFSCTFSSLLIWQIVYTCDAVMGVMGVCVYVCVCGGASSRHGLKMNHTFLFLLEKVHLNPCEPDWAALCVKRDF